MRNPLSFACCEIGIRQESSTYRMRLYRRHLAIYHFHIKDNLLIVSGMDK